MFETELLLRAFVWFLHEGGSATAAYFLMEKVPFLAKLEREYKRYVSLAISAVIAILVFLAGLGMGYYATPETARAWIETLFAVAFPAVTGAQVIHGATKLRARA